MTEWTDATTKKIAAVLGGVFLLIHFIEHPESFAWVSGLFFYMLSNWITAIILVAILALSLIHI